MTPHERMPVFSLDVTRTFLGNTCCSDYKSQCETGKAEEAQSEAPALTISGYTTYANAHCEDSGGASELKKHQRFSR